MAVEQLTENQVIGGLGLKKVGRQNGDKVQQHHRRTSRNQVFLQGLIAARLQMLDKAPLIRTEDIENKGEQGRLAGAVGRKQDPVVGLAVFSKNGEKAVAQQVFPCRDFTDEEFTVGDNAVVMVVNKLKIVEVVATRGFTKAQLNKATKWIVQRIDLTAHKERMEQQKVINDIKARLQQKKEELSEMAILKTLAQDDEETRNLLIELQNLTGQKLISIDKK